jgi:hypothetical protein
MKQKFCSILSGSEFNSLQSGFYFSRIKKTLSAVPADLNFLIRNEKQLRSKKKRNKISIC